MPRLSRAEHQARTKAALIDVGRRHFAEHGYAKASLDKIAADAGFTRGAIYANFDGKAGLLLAVLDIRLQDQIRDLQAIGSDLGQLDEWRRANARKQRGLSLAVLEFRVVALRDDRVRRQLLERERTLRRAFADLISRAAADLGIELPLPDEQIAAALLALGDGLTQQQRVDPDGIDPSTFASVLAILIRNLQP